jgi:branched-chain amino acid transport system ATP-binding protein
MLKLDNIYAHYGKINVLRGVSLEVKEGEAVALLGRNGVGKTTTLRTIMGLTPPSDGKIEFNGTLLTGMQPYKIPSQGVGYVPQGRGIFPQLTVYENLCVGLRHDPPPSELEKVFDRFPRLKERLLQAAGTLSGGEQQMLAIARCLVMRPKIMLLDEPTEGVMPILVATIRNEIKIIRDSGVALLLVEQNLQTALTVCNRVYIMEKGEICFAGTSSDLQNNPSIVQRHLGVSQVRAAASVQSERKNQHATQDEAE